MSLFFIALLYIALLHRHRKKRSFTWHFKLFICLKEKEGEIFYQLIHSPNDRQSQGWFKPVKWPEHHPDLPQRR